MLKKKDLAKLALTTLLMASGTSLQADTNDHKSEGVFLANTCKAGSCGALADTTGDTQRGSYSTGRPYGTTGTSTGSSTYGNDNYNSGAAAGGRASSGYNAPSGSYGPSSGYNTGSSYNNPSAAPSYGNPYGTPVDHSGSMPVDAPLTAEDQAFLRQVTNEKARAIYVSLDRAHRDWARQRVAQIRDANAAAEEAQRVMLDKKNAAYNSR